MTPFYLALGAASLAGALAALSALPQRDKIASVLPLFMLSAALTLTTNWNESGHLITGSLRAVATYSDGRPVETVLELYGSAGERRVRGLPITAPIPWLKQTLLGVCLLSLLGFLVSFRSRWVGPLSKRELLDMTAVLVLASVGALLAFNLPEKASNQEAVRQFINGFVSTQKIETFSLPSGDWSYRFSGLDPSGALAYCLFLAVAILAKPTGVLPLKYFQVAVPTLGILMVISVLWRATLVGGFPWHPMDSAVALSTTVIIFSVALRRHPRVISTLVMGSAIPMAFAALGS